MSKRQKAADGVQDTEIILLCAKYVALWHEQEVIAAADEWASDKGPLHPRFEAISAKEQRISRRLYELGLPRTEGGIVAMAQAAVRSWPKMQNGLACPDITRWMALAVIQGVAKTNEQVEPGHTLQYYLGMGAPA